MADLFSYTIPNLIQGVSQQPDAQRDPSQGELQVNGMSSLAEGLRKRDSTHTLARVSASVFGDSFVHTILRDQSEEYLAVIGKAGIKVFDLQGNEKTVVAPSGYGYLSSVTSARQQIRAVTIADYTFITNTLKATAMDPALAPVPSRPAPHEVLVWVKAANYGQTYTLNVNGTQVQVETSVAPVTSSGTTQVEHRISSEQIAETLKLGLEGRLTGVATITPNVPKALAISKPAAIAITAGSIFSGSIATINKLAGTGVRGTNGATYSNLPTTTNGLGFGATLTIKLATQGEKLKAITSVTLQAGGNGYKPGELLAINAFSVSSDPSDPTALNVASILNLTPKSGTNVPTTTSGSGRGMTVDISVGGDGKIASCKINQPGIGYALNDVIYVSPSEFIIGSTQPRVQVGTVSQMADGTPDGAKFTDVATASDAGAGATVDLVIKNGQVVSVALNRPGNGYVVGNALKVNPKDLDSTSTSTSLVTVATIASVLPLAGGAAGITVVRSGSVLWIRSNTPISLSATDARANADITAIFREVQAFTELPTIAPEGYQVEITGDPGNKFDGFYVAFKPRSGTFGEGSWVEVVSPGCEYRIDPTTMPHILARMADGTFLFCPADGRVQAGLTLPKWGDRTAGDYESSPDPSFIGQAINDIFIFKNRLGLLADENVILSRTRQLFEFFPETVTTVLDTDPIDVVASNNRVSVLRYAVPYQDELILFSSQYQFRFNSADTSLTPSTAQITVLTQFDVDVNVRPQQAGGGVVFCQANGQWSQFREFSIRAAGAQLTADAQDLTGNVSAYIPSGLFKMTVNDTSNALFAISGRDGYQDRIYLYKYYFRGSAGGVERAQSSWSYWDFAGCDEVLQVVCIRETLYCLMRYGDEVFLEALPVMDRMAEVAGAPRPLLLDRRVSTTTATQATVRMAKGTYDATKRETTWTLPYEARARTQLWSAYDYGQVARPGSVLLAEITSGTTLKARGDWSQAEVFAGEVYEFRYRFTRFKVMKEVGGGKAAINTMRTQVRHAKLRYHETGFFQAIVRPEHRREGVYTYDGTVAAVRNAMIGKEADTSPRYSEGVFTIPVNSRGEACLVEIVNDSPHPCKFSTCEWVALVTGRARALQ